MSTIEPALGADLGSSPWSKHTVSVRETRKGTLFALLAWVFAVYDFILFGTLLPVIAEDFGWSNATATGVNTAIAVGTAFVVLAVGPIVDRIGRRKGMLLTVSGTAVASGLTALTMNAAYLVGIRSIAGLGLAEQGVNTTYLNELYAVSEDAQIKKRRGFIYSIVQGGWPLGVLLAAGFSAVFLPIVGWRGCFLLATFPAIVIVLLRRTLRETPQFEIQDELRRLQKEGQTQEAAALGKAYGLDLTRATPLVEIFESSQRRNTIVLSLAWITNWFGITTFSILGTTVLTEGKGVDFAAALIMFVIINLIAFVGYLFHGWAGDRWGRRNVIGVGWLVSAVAFGAMLLIAEGDVAVVALYSIGMFFLVGPYAALLFYMGECYRTDCRATGASFLGAMSQPGAIVAGLIITSLLASGVSWNASALYVGVLGTLVSGLIMFAARPVTALEALDSELVPPGSHGAHLS
ncbi:MAG: MFS transporter [Actinomycetota bacterium]|nr:MFS transporter [Actinomycetota bacterium]